jgi:serine phosphatase RsbU (regulator of sigma subunit)
MESATSSSIRSDAGLRGDGSQRKVAVRRVRALVVGESLPPGTAASDALDLELVLPGDVPRDTSRWDVALLDGSLSKPCLQGVLVDLSRGAGPRPTTLVFSEPSAWGELRRFLGAEVDAFAERELLPGLLLDRIADAVEAHTLKADLAEKREETLALAAELNLVKKRMAEDLRLAGDVQRSLHPPPRRHPRLDICREFIPAREIGGDYYDFVPLSPERLVVAVGDVMGKGVPAALLAANLKASLRAQVQSGVVCPAELLSKVNQLFFDVNPRGRFSSLFVGIFRFDTGHIEFANAGHPRPFLVGQDGFVADLEGAGPALGLVEDAAYARFEVRLSVRDLLVFFSDGVTDRENPEGEGFGLERLKQAAVASRADPARIALYSILGDLQGWSHGEAPGDDLTLVLTKVH